jgi:hypothetical protein
MKVYLVGGMVCSDRSTYIVGWTSDLKEAMVMAKELEFSEWKDGKRNPGALGIEVAKIYQVELPSSGEELFKLLVEWGANNMCIDGNKMTRFSIVNSTLSDHYH